MKNPKEFLFKRETAFYFDKRLKYFVETYVNYKKKFTRSIKILDIGCGKNIELYKYKQENDIYYGCDFYKEINIKIDDYKHIDLNEEKLTNTYTDEKFDVIFCGEIIEHLFSPDNLLEEIKPLMHKDSILILSTPNLSYYLNRIMLLLGISPFFLENSSEVKLGRKLKFLGQFNKTEGHIKVFTYGAIKDLLKISGFKIINIKSVPFWDNIVDRLVCLVSKSLSANNIFVLKIE